MGIIGVSREENGERREESAAAGQWFTAVKVVEAVMIKKVCKLRLGCSVL